jgi:thioredoxin 1
MPRFDTPLTTNDQSVDRVLQNGLPVALLIWDGSNINLSLEESLRQVAKDDAGRLLVAKLNALENPQTSGRMNGSSLPALITFRDGQEVSRTHDVTSSTFRAHVAYLLGRGPRPEETQPKPHETTASKPVVVSDATFQSEVLESDLPVLVDLWAPWCGPCRLVAPILDQLAAKYRDKVRIGKINVDEQPELAAKFRVMSIPTLILFKDGKPVQQMVGLRPAADLEDMLDRHISQR